MSDAAMIVVRFRYGAKTARVGYGYIPGRWSRRWNPADIIARGLVRTACQYMRCRPRDLEIHL